MSGRPTADIEADLRGPTDWIEEVVRCEAADRLAELDAENRALTLALRRAAQ